MIKKISMRYLVFNNDDFVCIEKTNLSSTKSDKNLSPTNSVKGSGVIAIIFRKLITILSSEIIFSIKVLFVL